MCICFVTRSNQEVTVQLSPAVTAVSSASADSKLLSAATGTGTGGGSSGGDLPTRRVRIVGLTATGYLQAADVDTPSVSYELHPDGNSFDFLKGLVAQKVIPPTPATTTAT